MSHVLLCVCYMSVCVVYAFFRGKKNAAGPHFNGEKALPFGQAFRVTVVIKYMSLHCISIISRCSL